MMFKIIVAILSLGLMQVKADWCNVCHQLENETCLEPMNNAFSEECDEDEGFSCYTRLVDGNLIERGCIDKLDENERLSCIDEHNCQLCNDNNCNNEIYPKNRLYCHTCKQDCQREFIQDIPSICSNYHPDDKCFVSHNTRGCLFSSIHQCNNEKCFICDTNGCNDNIFSSATIEISATNLINVLLFLIALIP